MTGNKTREHARVPVVRGPALDGEILPPESDPPPQPPPPKVKPKPLTLDDLKRRRGESDDDFWRRLPSGIGPRWGEGKSDAWKKRLEKARRKLRPITEQQRAEQRAERVAVQQAERAVALAWPCAPRAHTINSAEREAWLAARWRAMSEARAAAREEVRRERRIAEEERKTREVPLPAHITRVRTRR
jgi:hypothetical protein